MAEEKPQKPLEEDREATEAQSQSSGKKSFWARFLPRKWTAIILGASMANFAGGFVCSRVLFGPSRVTQEPEFGLGEFRFEARSSELGKIGGAEFSLYIALLDSVDQEARQRLQTHKYRVSQNVEELLRKAHGGDFDDPSLGGLKRQLQEQINETLGMRAIADVMITNLRLLPRDEEAPSVTATTDPPHETVGGLLVGGRPAEK